MAANKFTTLLHRNTNKITLVLVYALLEWILIILLLLNSLFSYLIIKFADYFGLKRPCIFCTRIDHIIESGKSKFSCKDLVCETHAKEISKLDFCLNHQKLAESREMCEDCSSSSQPDYVKFLKSFGLFQWMKQIGMIQDSADKAIENGEESLKCSCCGVSLDGRFYPPCILVKPSFRMLDYTQEQNLIRDGEVEVDAEIDEADHHSDQSRPDVVLDHHEDEQSIGENRKTQMVSDVDVNESCVCPVCGSGKEIVSDENYKLNLEMEKEKEPFKEEALSFPNDDQNCEETTLEVREKIDGIRPQHLEFFIYGDDCSLIPVELVDSPATESRNQRKYKVGDQGHSANEDVILDFDLLTGAEAEPIFENWHTSADIMALFSSNESRETTMINGVESIESKVGEIQVEEANLEQNYQEVKISETTEHPPKDENVEEASLERRDEEISSDVSLASEEGTQMQNDESEAEVSIGTEIPDHEPMDEYQSPDTLLDLNQTMEEEPSTSLIRFHVQDDSGYERAEEEFVEFKTMSIQTCMPKLENNHMSSCLDLNENDEDKVPDTPTSVESPNHLHKKLQLLERKESATEDSLDESVISDLESGELTIEKLKSALEAERKALNTLYAELEEERSASAVAANQTMAMINRLQEEKAAMQMEALQYQRMMEEQSEYDQEALQLLNELMVKREKEKQELEKELELCRKKVLEYEVREEKRLSRSNGSIRSRNSSASCSSCEDSDELSVDLNIEAKEESDLYGHEESSNENTPVDAVIYLEESLANFEEERLSILEHLKVLEEKLVMLNYEEEHFDDFKGHVCEKNGNGYYDHDDSDKCKVNGFANGHAKEMNGKHHQGRKTIVPKGKRLLPLFDAISTETESGIFSGDENGSDFGSDCSTEKVELEKKRLALEEEVDNVYDRLQALEADREFLRHCISSMRKGDKGLNLLQEILQHLRVLRNVELRVKNNGGVPAA